VSEEPYEQGRGVHDQLTNRQDQRAAPSAASSRAPVWRSLLALLALLPATRLRVPSGGSYGSGGPVDQRAVVPVGAEQ
jgi:hypothetical protein